MPRAIYSYCLFALLSLASSLAAQKPDFQRDVRPILSDACFHCHGPDRSTRMMGLRLDLREGAYEKRRSGQVVTPGSAAKSLLYQRITAAGAKRMPPSYSHKTLTPEQIDTLRRWINEGAEWREHWAFRAPVRGTLPAVKDASWVRNPIDRFILAALQRNGLTPAKEAGKRTLIRRLTLDLTGLPPTPDEVESFVNDSSPDAYEKVVERLLASPRWGEHRARYWLDAARYADTHGIHIDNERDIWPYRDWVIKAFNRNMPFDQFTVEQLAGDLMPSPTLEQRIATGFQRCNPTTNEAGVIIEEIEAMYAKDRADTVGAVWLGMTVGCATCHDHKFDPIPQRDFYALTAFFRNTTQHAMDGNISDTPPVVVVPSADDRPRWDELSTRRSELSRGIENAKKASAEAADRWASTLGKKPAALPSELFALDLEGSFRVRRSSASQTPAWPQGLTLGGSPWPETFALHFARNAWVELDGVPEVGVSKPMTLSAWFFLPKGEESYTIATMQDAKDKGRGWSFHVSGRVPGVRFIGDEGRSVEVRAGHLDQLTPGTWNHVVASYDGSGDVLGVRLFVNSEEVRTQRNTKARFSGDFATGAPIKLGNPGKSFDPAGALADFRILASAADDTYARLLGLWPKLGAALPANATDEQREALRLYHLLHHDNSYAALRGEIDRIDFEQRLIRRRGTVSLVMEERKDQSPFAHLLYRGMYDQPREKLVANTPSALPPMPDGLPRNRLGLAKWLVSEENPMTARVTVNRFWQQVFGDGIVRTADDFGSQGEAPSNQELLDWLAVEFRESGWDVKHIFRLLVTSATYRQSSFATPVKLEKDPGNLLLSRGPRFRMDAEMVRDHALAASGLLSTSVGGRSVKPYQPSGVWEAVAMKESDTRFYNQDHGVNLYRRSLYTFWKRSAPPASMEIFNAPTRETCTVRRERTNTPLQALVTMNDPQFVEAARVLAEQAYLASESFESRLQFMSLALMSRSLTPEEVSIVRQSYAAFLRHYDSNPGGADALIYTGQWPKPVGAPAAEIAAYTMVANQLMNLDEVLVK